MKAVVFAYHNIGCAALQSVLDANIEVLAVFTHIDDSRETIFFESVAKLAAHNNIRVYAPQDVNHPLWIERIRQLQPDIIFSFYYRHLLSRDILDITPDNAFNLHGSLLPAYRGRAPINWALINGETETGLTLHCMTEKADAGDIVVQQKITISASDTALTLHQKMTELTSAMLDNILPAIIIGQHTLSKQDESQATYFGRRRP
ncbi:MAG: formyltransferase family protein, partial [Psychromonas sp.]